MKLSSDQKILAVCSTVDFKNFTRRATLEAIHDQHSQMDLLLFNGVRSVRKEVNQSEKISTYTYYKWLPGNLAETKLLGGGERFFRGPSWKKFFTGYGVVFLSDPNQHILLDYIENKTLMVYLIRDPNVLQNQLNKKRERKILDRSDLVVATSKNLAEKYVGKYHEMEHPNIHYWPNCVNLDLWDADRILDRKRIASRRKQFPKRQAAGEEDHEQKKIIGVAGNFGSKRTDYNLLDKTADAFPDMTLEIAGQLDQNDHPAFWEELLKKQNVHYLGFIPQENLPGIVSRWSVGLITDRINEYASYMHHNKVYQYLSVGVPVISLKIHDDYQKLHPYVQYSETVGQFVHQIDKQIQSRADIEFRKGCIQTALENTAEIRAKIFIDLLHAAL